MSVDQTSRTELQKEIVSVEARLTELDQRALQLTHRLERTVVKARKAAPSTICRPIRSAASLPPAR